MLAPIGTARGLGKCSRRARSTSAVWFLCPMGLLDDAIREHMELKRLRGADPSEVARQESEVLGRVPRRGDAEGEEPTDEDALDEAAGEDHTPETDDSPIATPGGHDADFANVGQETAEFDMSTVLDEQHEAEGVTDHSHPTEPAIAPGEEGEPVEDVLEETPDFLRDTPEQERLWFEQQPPRDFDFDK
jgi:hypothetical protein